jgi:autoinducer 2-degrading protein
MHVTFVYVHVREEYISEFIEASRVNRIESVKEPGNLRFDVLQNAEDSSHFVLYEGYESDEAAAAHKNTPHYLKWREAVANWMAEPRKGVKYNVLFPSERSEW